MLAKWAEPSVFPSPLVEKELVGAFFGDRRGVFVEVGANDPVVESQTWHLEQRGWRGLLIEPAPEAAARLRAKRAAKVAEFACGSPEQSGQSMQLMLAGGSSTLGETFRTPPAYAPLPSAYQRESCTVRLETLDNLLRAAGIEKVDFVSIDVEGHELDALRGFSLERYRPALVLLEDFAVDFERHRHMRRHGYKRVRRTHWNSWYVPRATKFPVSLFGRWQLFRKFVLAVPLHAIKSRWQLWRGPRRVARDAPR